ncbi:MAG: 2-amino-4-hydroxy-6-hydroxymethyldihydropteridine diphosphokinase [Pyrinomonadaceae bacterium]
MDTEHTVAYIGLGSNLGDRAGNLLMAVRGLMEASFVVHKLSGIYETEPVGIDTDKKFLNMVAEIHVTNVTPSQMMARLLRIEYLLGRTDKSLKKPRTIDLDILLFGDMIVNTEFLTLPHPRLHERRFVLKPLAKLAPNFVHPVLNQEIADILETLDDPSEVKRWLPNAADNGQSASELQVASSKAQVP